VYWEQVGDQQKRPLKVKDCNFKEAAWTTRFELASVPKIDSKAVAATSLARRGV
jgi:hypothetical protein